MSDGAQDYNTAAIRQLLLAAFTPEELRRFCYDRPDLRPAVSQFGPGHGHDDMVDELITYCDTRLLLGKLLTQVRQANPGQYARFAPYLLGEAKSPTATTMAVPAPEKASVASSPARPGAKPRRDWLIIVPSIAAVLALIVAVLAWIGPFGDDEPTPQPSPSPSPTEPAGPAAASPTPTPTQPPEPQSPTPTPAQPPEPPTSTPAPTSTPSTCLLGDAWTRPTDGMVMVCVPAGEFLMGSSDDDSEVRDDERPQHEVYLEAFWIDKTEVTNAQYRKCVEAGACKEPYCWDESNYSKYTAPDQPVVCVTWYEAQEYAAWAGGRLPTEAEWEKAARGTDGRIYPWGDSPPNCEKANYGDCAGQPLPVGSLPDGAGLYGALDMAGNVFEWVADRYVSYYYFQSPSRNPQGPESGSGRVMRGGAFDRIGSLVRCAYRGWLEPGYWNPFLGFRVVVAPGPAGP